MKVPPIELRRRELSYAGVGPKRFGLNYFIAGRVQLDVNTSRRSTYFNLNI